MLRCLTAFLRKDKLLVQLLSRADARVDDWNVNFWAQAAHANHLSGQVVDSNTLAHFQHEDVAPAGQTSCLDNEPGSLRYVHEIAGHLRVRHRYRASHVD